jgi:hypothetical protein
MGTKTTPSEVSEYLAKIGRKGGQVSGRPKGFAAMTPEQRKEIAAKGLKKRQAKAKKKSGPKAAKK